jgi:hypothetical protein
MIELDNEFCVRAKQVIELPKSGEYETPFCFKTSLCPCKKSQGQYDVSGKGYCWDNIN